MPSPFLHFGLIAFSNRRKAFSGFNQFAVIFCVRTMPTNISAACSSQVLNGGNTLEPFGGSNLLTKQQIASSGLSVCDIAQSIFTGVIFYPLSQSSIQLDCFRLT